MFSHLLLNFEHKILATENRFTTTIAIYRLVGLIRGYRLPEFLVVALTRVICMKTTIINYISYLKYLKTIFFLIFYEHDILSINLKFLLELIFIINSFICFFIKFFIHCTTIFFIFYYKVFPKTKFNA